MIRNTFTFYASSKDDEHYKRFSDDFYYMLEQSKVISA